MKKLCPKCQKYIHKQHLPRHLKICYKENYTPIMYFENMIEDSYLTLINKYQSGVSIYELKVNPEKFKELLIYLNIRIRSASEQYKTEHYKNKMETYFTEKYNVKNPSSLSSSKLKRKDTCINRYGVSHNFLIPEIREIALLNAKSPESRKKAVENIKKTMISRYGVENPSQLESVRKLCSERNKFYFSKMTKEEKRLYTEPARRCIKYTSKLESRISTILSSNNILFRQHYFIGGFNYDFIFDGNKLLEVNGDYWHANPIIYKPNDLLLENWYAKDVWDKDLYKSKYAEDKGFYLSVIWETEMNSLGDNELWKLLKNKLSL